MKEEIRILYVEDFKHKVPNSLSEEGELKKGKLYRALYMEEDSDVETKSGIIGGYESFYRLLLELKDGTYGSIGMHNLEGDNPVWEWKIKRVTAENITEFELSSEQYKRLASWKESMHKDLDFLKEPPTEDINIDVNEDEEESEINVEVSGEGVDMSSLQNIFDAVHQALSEEENDYDSMSTIYVNHPFMAHAIDEVVDFIADDITSQDSVDFVDMYSFQYDKGHGKSVNTFKAMENINDYLKTKDSENLTSIFKAIHFLLAEVARNSK